MAQSAFGEQQFPPKGTTRANLTADATSLRRARCLTHSIFALPAEQPEPVASLKKSSTIGGSRSGRRSKNISDLSAEELQIARKIALIQLTAMMERGRGAFAMNASRNIVKTITNAFRLRGSDRPRGTHTDRQ